MQRYFADVNVWFALAVEEHGDHRLRLRVVGGDERGVRMTQLRVLRLLTSEPACATT